MTRRYTFDRTQLTPVVGARIYGRDAHRAVRLVFDTGAAVTQLHTPVIDSLGYSAVESSGLTVAYGPADDAAQYVASAITGGHNTISNQERAGPDVIGNHIQ